MSSQENAFLYLCMSSTLMLRSHVHQSCVHKYINAAFTRTLMLRSHVHLMRIKCPSNANRIRQSRSHVIIFLMRIEFESANSHYPIRFNNTFSFMRIR